MITRIPWNAEAEMAMSHEAGRRCVPLLRAEVERGVSKLWRCEDGKDIAYMVTRLDENPRELVICYMQGRGIAKFAPEVIGAARAAGVPIRVHTTQPALVRYLRRFQLAPCETVLRSTWD